VAIGAARELRDRVAARDGLGPGGRAQRDRYDGMVHPQQALVRHAQPGAERGDGHDAARRDSNEDSAQGRHAGSIDDARA
jgi:hypothetical protein